MKKEEFALQRLQSHYVGYDFVQS